MSLSHWDSGGFCPGLVYLFPINQLTLPCRRKHPLRMMLSPPYRWFGQECCAKAMHSSKKLSTWPELTSYSHLLGYLHGIWQTVNGINQFFLFVCFQQRCLWFFSIKGRHVECMSLSHSLSRFSSLTSGFLQNFSGYSGYLSDLYTVRWMTMYFCFVLESHSFTF